MSMQWKISYKVVCSLINSIPESSKHLQKIQIVLDISCFDLKGEYKEEEKMKKYADMVKNLKVGFKSQVGIEITFTNMSIHWNFKDNLLSCHIFIGIWKVLWIYPIYFCEKFKLYVVNSEIKQINLFLSDLRMTVLSAEPQNLFIAYKGSRSCPDKTKCEK